MPPPTEAGPPQADAPVQRAQTMGAGRRRYYETGARRRGVSPVGTYRIAQNHMLIDADGREDP